MTEEPKKKIYKGHAGRARNLSNSRAQGVYETIAVKPATAVIGGIVSGVDITQPVSDAQIDDLSHALADHNVLFFRDQPELTPDQQIDFANKFGELHAHPAAPHAEGHPELFIIHTHKKSQVNNGGGWHTDVSCDETPPLGTMLQLHTVPEVGGDTLFANMYAAFDGLSDSMKDFLRTCTAMHESEHIYRGRYSDRGVDDADKVYPSAEHPIVRTHPVSGREALYVNRAFTTKIVDLEQLESDALLKFLYTHLEQAQFQVRFQWEENSIAFWDNRCTQHLALWDYWPEERKGHRVTIKGERPFHRKN
jgi:taurine dioxygenase